jgi:hypothetical protein
MLNALMPGHRSRPALVIGLAVRYRCRPFLQVNILSDMSARSPWSWHADPCFGWRVRVLDLVQSGEGPERYGGSLPLGTIPSSPVAQACRKLVLLSGSYCRHLVGRNYLVVKECIDG